MYINFSSLRGIVGWCGDNGFTCVAVMGWRKPFPSVALGGPRQASVP